METLEKQLSDKLNLFKTEVDAIKEQISFIENSIIVEEIRGACSTCVSDILNDQTIEEVANYPEIQNKLNKRKKELEDQNNNIEYYIVPDRYLSIDQRSEMCEFMSVIFEHIYNGERDNNHIAQLISSDLEAMCINYGELKCGFDFYNLYYNKDSLIELIDNCLKINNNLQKKRLEYDLKKIENYIHLMKLVDVSNKTNIYRQSFIQLVSLMDTTIFEIIRIMFKDNFFEWIKDFSDGNIKYSEIADFNDFDSFTEGVIETKLKNCYLKDLLIVLERKDKSIFIVNNDDKYKNYREMINRRNCHIHNNGIVDKKYTEEYNIYSYDMGQYLSIDKEYFEKVDTLCELLIERLINQGMKNNASQNR